MRIAICDDCMQFRENIFKLISSNLKSPNNILFAQFSSAEEILKAYESGKRYDLIFLDVEMGMVNGIDAGIKIRQYDAKAIIIFVSSYPKYAISAYDCEAFYFVVKPIDSDKVKQVLTKAIEKHTLLHQYYIIKNKGQTQKCKSFSKTKLVLLAYAKFLHCVLFFPCFSIILIHMPTPPPSPLLVLSRLM